MRWMLLLLCFFTFNITLAASFDCAKAKTGLEKLICQNDTLSDLDSRMASAYKRALGEWGGKIKAYVQADQREYLAEMREIENEQSDTEPVCESLKDTACVKQKMMQRLDALESASYAMSGVYVLGKQAKLLVTPLKNADYRLTLYKPGSSLVLRTPEKPSVKQLKWNGPNTMEASLEDADFKPSCEVSISFQASQAVVKQSGKCGGNNFAGVYQRNVKETLRAYELSLD